MSVTRTRFKDYINCSRLSGCCQTGQQLGTHGGWQAYLVYDLAVSVLFSPAIRLAEPFEDVVRETTKASRITSDSVRLPVIRVSGLCWYEAQLERADQSRNIPSHDGNITKWVACIHARCVTVTE